MGLTARSPGNRLPYHSRQHPCYSSTLAKPRKLLHQLDACDARGTPEWEEYSSYGNNFAARIFRIRPCKARSHGADGARRACRHSLQTLSTRRSRVAETSRDAIPKRPRPFDLEPKEHPSYALGHRGSTNLNSGCSRQVERCVALALGDIARADLVKLRFCTLTPSPLGLALISGLLVRVKNV